MFRLTDVVEIIWFAMQGKQDRQGRIGWSARARRATYQRDFTRHGLWPLRMCGCGLLGLVDLDAVCEVGQLGRRRLHGQGIFFGVKTGEWCRIANKDMWVFACQTGSRCNRLCLDAFTKLQVVSTRARLRRVSINVNGHGLGSLWPKWLGLRTGRLCHGDKTWEPSGSVAQV